MDISKYQGLIYCKVGCDGCFHQSPHKYIPNDKCNKYCKPVATLPKTAIVINEDGSIDNK